jgi:uncharacterized protein YndB with AHSA1/START domain
MNSPTDRIERKIMLMAPRSRVWRALSSTVEFGRWFGVTMESGSFGVGQRLLGHVMDPGYEHVVFDVHIERFEPERFLSWRWHPAPVEPGVDYSGESATLVQFELSDAEGGTLLRVVESGFDKVPPNRRVQAFRLNSAGWDQQMENIRKHVAAR